MGKDKQLSESDKPLAGKRALITGASRGLGDAIARRFAAAGAELALAARDHEALKSVAAQVEGKTQLIAVDLSAANDVERLIDECGEVDILVNNAAVQGPIGPFASVDFAAWQAVFQVNLFAPARICGQLVEQMKQRKWGKIINLSGGGATGPRPDFSAYAASKCALVRFSETLAAELSGAGIDVNCMAPGAMNTRMLEEVLAAGPGREFERAIKQKQSGGASPQQAAELALFLASPASDGITGRLFSAVWDPWQSTAAHRQELEKSDIYTLRRIVPEDRGQKW